MVKQLLSIGLLSAMLLTLQLCLIQALSFVQGHHLAYVILSIALLGFGAGGAVLTLFRRVPPQRLEAWYGPLASCAGVWVAWMPRFVHGWLQDLEVDLLFTGPGPWLQVAGLGVMLCVPFFLGALALSILFRTRSREIGTIYAGNLAGSGLGALLAIPLLMMMLPEHVLPLCGLMSVVAGALYGGRARWHCACGLLVLAAWGTTPAWSPSQYRDLAYALQLPEQVRAGPYAHYYGRLDVVEAPALRHAPDVSLQYRGRVPSAPHVFVSGNRAGVLLDLSEPESRILAHTPQGLPYALRAYDSVLLLAPDGNAPVVLAADGSQSVRVVESHPLVAQRLAGAMPLGIELVRADPRAYLARAAATSYDLIVFPMRGLFGGPSGLQALGSDSLFTTEGVARSLALLDGAGWLAFPVWLDEPLRHSLRVLDLIRSGLATVGIARTEEHVLVLRGWGSVFFMVSREPVSAATRAKAQAFASAQGFDLLHPANEEVPMRHGPLDAPPARWLHSLLGADADAFLDSYRFDVRAPTDARPFFNQFIRPGDLARDLDWLSVSERGLAVLYVLLLQLVIAVLLIVFLPLWPLRRQLAGGAGTVGYFGGLGAGFMLYEIALIQLLIPVWGTPVTGTAFVITTLLLGMAMGSHFMQGVPKRWQDCRLLTGCVAFVLLLVGLVLPVVIRVILPYGGLIRFLVLFPLLLVPAIALGMPFPVGVRYLHANAPQQIPWACGIDGGMAVLAAPLAGILAYYFGYPVVVFLAASGYALSALCTAAGWGHMRGRLL